MWEQVHALVVLIIFTNTISCTNFTTDIENVTIAAPYMTNSQTHKPKRDENQHISSNNPESQITTYLTESTSVDDPHWVAFNPDTDALPADAIVGGYEHETLYISRAYYRSTMTPGKFVPSLRKAVISWGFQTYVINVTEILCGRNYQWVPTYTTANITEEAFEVAETLYICRANYSGHLIIGKTRTIYHACFLPYEDQEIIIYYNFEILAIFHKSSNFTKDIDNVTIVEPNVTDSQTYESKLEENHHNINTNNLESHKNTHPTAPPEHTTTAITPRAPTPTTTPREQTTTTTPRAPNPTTASPEHTTTTTPRVPTTNITPREQTPQCLIPRKLSTDHTMPIISIPSSVTTWPTLESTTNYLQVETGQTVIFFCDKFGGETRYFRKFPDQNAISARCIGQDKFMAEDKSYKISELLCAEVQTVVTKKHDKCLSETSQLFRVGYDVLGFSETYKVCFDAANEIPLYSHVKMSKSNRGGDVTYKWHKYGALDAHRDTYTCDNTTSSCCYSKAQLVNARDVSAGAPQRTTFIDPLNAVPHWRPCGMTQSPWENIEDTVRSLIDSYDQFDVWSGTHMLHKNNGTVTPRHLWKLIRFDDTKAIAVVYVNGPSPSEADILCKNTCGDNEAVPWSYNYSEHTYCCNVDEFLHAFGLGGSAVGKPTRRSFDMILRKNYSTSNLLLRKLTERTSYIQMTQQIHFTNSKR